MGTTTGDPSALGSLASEDWVEVGSGESSSRVFASADGARYAKVASVDQMAELAGERDRARWAADRGVRGPQVLGWVESADGAVLTTGAVPGVPADQVRPDQVGRAWANVVAAVRELHDLPLDACPFDRGLRTMLALAQDVVARDAVHPEFLRPEQEGREGHHLLAELATELPVRLEQEASERVVCHGDLCLPNVLLDPETLEVSGFVDLGRLGVADRHADLSLLLASAQDTWPDEAQHIQDQLPSLYGSPVDADRLRFHLFLDPLTWD
ncbi:aminoglycoside 3'-phosphotransferase [Cellulosimicrobium protaetiae]|uniref:Aminoglycoside 3'-phosphotransferase n=1 Tax=Cellulosimicrobium protaetiae TaxID=2587808 RepID=A0A6M5UIA9_9MICO|nr:aminoglycoside 3'-phosphotransferase [Cellulosimicrobium protaetiae]QJW37824.1 aminoglycoside 3'-phosphotransferase [Cellulosimicrobium protaetiae]